MRDEADRHIARGDAPSAARALSALWRAEPGPSAAAFLISRFESLRTELALTPFRLAILRSFTVEPLIPLLRAAAFEAGIDLTVHTGEFNAWAQEMLDPASALYRFEPNAVILAVLAREAAAGVLLDGFRDAIQSFRRHSRASLIVHNFEQPATTPSGILDAQRAENAWAHANERLRQLAREHPGVYVLDYDALTARHGRASWGDLRKWLTMRMPIAASNLIHLSREWLRFLHPLSGKISKALVVDLDNTLWGGVIGEDGIDGIRLGPEYPGACYQALQRALLDLYSRGILLAVASKNNPQDALEAIERHPGMLLRPSHFAALRVHWNDKVQSLREIAQELNIGLDALAFLDDNPVERQRVREELPEVTVIEMPENPADFDCALRDCPVFERLTLSDEDARRGELYALERQRTQLARTCSTPEDFYRSLAQEAEIAPVSSATLGRVAQLTQKTNQFNLTTHRYTEPEIERLAAGRDSQVFSLRVRDRYADNGLVGVAILQDRGEVTLIDTFLLSCRVIGRTLETAFLAFLAEQSRARGSKRLEGWFLPTKKNAPAAEFYSRHGFELVRNQDDSILWAFDLSRRLHVPEWVRIVIPEGVPT